MSLRVVPLTLNEANAAVALWHRHHKPVVGHRFSVGAVTKNNTLVGAAIVGRPVGRRTNWHETAEVTRLVTDGTKNACSILYGACARAAAAMGFAAIQTFILDTESGSSLKASGYVHVGDSRGGTWNRTSRDGRRNDQPLFPKQRWERRFTRRAAAVGEP